MRNSPEKDEARQAKLRHSTVQQYKMEAVGLLILAALIIAVTLIRYWHNISWNLR